MKKILLLLLAALLLTGCSNNTNSSTATEAGATSNSNTNETKTKVDEFPLTVEEALRVAEDVIENAANTVYAIWLYEGEEPSEEQMQERLNETKKYVTTNFFDTHLADLIRSCTEEECPDFNFPLNPYFGLREEINPISATQYSASMVFATMDHEASNSYRQTVDFHFEDGAWKINSFSNKEEDLNLQAEEIEGFLKKKAMNPINIEFVGTNTIQGREEQLYQFQDADTLYPFELIARTGHYYYIGEEFDYEELGVDEDMIGSDFDFYYSLLFDDQSIYKVDIETSAPKVQQFMQRLDALEDEWQWAPPYYEEDRAWIQGLHETYTTLYSDVYDYYVNQFPTVEGVNQLEQHNKSFHYVREEYFESIGVSLFSLYDESVSSIAEDIEILRNQIYKIMLFSIE